MEAPATMKPRTPEELLDRQAAAARRELLGAALLLADEVRAAVDLRGRVRRHPVLSLAVALGLGWTAGPALARGLRGSRLAAVALTALLKRQLAGRG